MATPVGLIGCLSGPEQRRENAFDQQWRGDKDDDQRLDDADHVDRHPGVHLHLPPPGLKRAEQQPGQKNADRVRTPKKCYRDGAKPDAGGKAGRRPPQNAADLCCASAPAMAMASTTVSPARMPT